MEDLIIRRTPTTPQVNFNFAEGTFSIEGVIDPEDPLQFFEDACHKLDGYSSEQRDASTVTITPVYIRSTSIPALLKLMRKFYSLQKHGQKVSVTWVTRKEDEALRQTGEELSRRCLLNFEFTEK